MENGIVKRFTRVLLLMLGIIVVQTYGASCGAVKPSKKQVSAQGFWKKLRSKVQNFVKGTKEELAAGYDRVVNPEPEEELEDENEDQTVAGTQSDELEDEAIEDNDADYESYTSDDAENQENSDQDDAAEDADQEDTQSDASQDEVVEPSSTDDEDDY